MSSLHVFAAGAYVKQGYSEIFLFIGIRPYNEEILSVHIILSLHLKAVNENNY